MPQVYSARTIIEYYTHLASPDCFGGARGKGRLSSCLISACGGRRFLRPSCPISIWRAGSRTPKGLVASNVTRWLRVWIGNKPARMVFQQSKTCKRKMQVVIGREGGAAGKEMGLSRTTAGSVELATCSIRLPGAVVQIKIRISLKNHTPEKVPPDGKPCFPAHTGPVITQKEPISRNG
jgi:hypothetical protein